MHYHKVFGMTIESGFPLPELIAIDAIDNPSIQINYGKVERPEDNLPDVTYGPWQVFGSHIYYLNVNELYKYRVDKEDQKPISVTVELSSDENVRGMYAFLYGSILTAILQLRDQFALHASAVAVNGELYLFCGPSGAGKSTLAAQLNIRGYKLFSDDKCVVSWNEDEKKYYAQPTLKIIRLWEDATENLQNDEFLVNATPVMDKLNKYQYTLDKESIIDYPMPINRIHMIRGVEKDNPLSIKKLSGAKKLKFLRLQTHRLEYVRRFNKKEIHWDFIQKLASRVPTYAIRRPSETTIHDFVDYVEKQF